MRGFIDRILIFICCSFMFWFQNNDTEAVIIILFMLAFVCFNYVFEYKLLQYTTTLLFLISSMCEPEILYFLPCFCYAFWKKECIYVFVFEIFCIKDYCRPEKWSSLCFIVIGIGITAYCRVRTDKLNHLEKKIKEIRDNSAERNMELKHKNRILIENQDYKVRIATLNERNRIAREIHDNVGHMLSRSILQVGALLSITKDDNYKAMLKGLNETLDTAMNSIRESVHDLRDEALDLDESIRKLLEGYTGYKISYTYNMESQLDKNVKFSFLATVKEALVNVVKHSDATMIVIYLMETPEFYQLSIKDNGTIQKNVSFNGMGLENMKVRAETLGGRFCMNTEQGFQIYIAIPKQNDNEVAKRENSSSR